MGWSEQTILPQIDYIFKRQKQLYKLTLEQASYPMISIQCEKTIPLRVAEEIIALFPDFVHVGFVMNSKFSDSYKGQHLDFKRRATDASSKDSVS